MPKADEDGGVVQESRAAQSAASKGATLDILLSKKRPEETVHLEINGSSTAFTFRAIGAVDYDKLLTKHPPTTDQRSEGAVYNINSFAPALISRVCVDPDLTTDDWGKVWNSPDWGRGELMQLFATAVQVCNTTLKDVGPTATG